MRNNLFQISSTGKANARFDYYMQKNVNEVTLINKCTNEKDIGVIFYENLSFDAHKYTEYDQ